MIDPDSISLDATVLFGGSTRSTGSHHYYDEGAVNDIATSAQRKTATII